MRELGEELGRDVRATFMRVGQPVVLDFASEHNPKYRGQMLTPMLMRYMGGTIDISRIEDGDTKPAFSAYAWRPAEEVLALATLAKQPVYAQVLDSFGLLPQSPGRSLQMAAAMDKNPCQP